MLFYANIPQTNACNRKWTSLLNSMEEIHPGYVCLLFIHVPYYWDHSRRAAIPWSTETKKWSTPTDNNAFIWETSLLQTYSQKVSSSDIGKYFGEEEKRNDFCSFDFLKKLDTYWEIASWKMRSPIWIHVLFRRWSLLHWAYVRCHYASADV